jgi:hypothetical protein
MSQISLQELVAVNSTPKSRALLVKYGYQPARNIDDLVDKLFVFTRDYEDQAIKEMSAIHPHKDMVLHYANEEIKMLPVVEPLGSAKQTHSNFDMEQYLDFMGKNAASKTASPMEKLNEYLPILVVAGLFALAITVTGRKTT